MKIFTITAVALAALTLPSCCEAGCGEKGPWIGGKGEEVTSATPYGTICETLIAYKAGMEACKNEANEDGFVGCIEGMIGTTYDQSLYHAEHHLTDCDDGETCCEDLASCWEICKAQDTKCVSDDEYADLAAWMKGQIDEAAADRTSAIAGDNNDEMDRSCYCYCYSPYCPRCCYG